MVDRAVAVYLGLLGETSQEDQPAAPESVTLDITLCGQRVFAGEAPTTDLSAFGGQLGTSVAGVLAGRSMYGTLELEFGQRAVLWQSAIVIAGRDPNRVGLKAGSYGSSVTCILDGSPPFDAVVDTLFEGTLRLPAGQLATGGDAGVTVNGTGQRFLRRKLLQAGASEFRNPVCTVVENAPVAALGVGCLRHFRVVLALPGKFLRLEPPAAVGSEEPPVQGVGVLLGRLTEQGWTVDVLSGSPAEEAGVKPGDVLAAVHGVSLAGVPFDQAVQLLTARGGPEVRLDLLRDGAPYAVGLAPRVLF